MDTKSKTSWGLVLWIGGKVGLLIALLLSLTGIGACLGIPLALVCVPCIICGVILYFQARSEMAKEIIAAGVRQGIVEAQGRALPGAPQPNQQPYQAAAIAVRAEQPDGNPLTMPEAAARPQLASSTSSGTAASQSDGNQTENPDGPDASPSTTAPLP
jgi:hypothetical protein